MVELIPSAEPWKMSANYRWPEFNTTIGQVFAGVWAARRTVDGALSEAKAKLPALLDKPAID